jgi:hypothetical protein
MLPVDEVRIEGVEMNDIGLGKSIYTKKLLDEFAAFQDSQGTRKAQQLSLIDLIGMSFIPMHSVDGPLMFFLYCC